MKENASCAVRSWAGDQTVSVMVDEQANLLGTMGSTTAAHRSADAAWSPFAVASAVPPIMQAPAATTPHVRADVPVVTTSEGRHATAADVTITTFRYRVRWDTIVPVMMLIVLALVGMPYAMNASGALGQMHARSQPSASHTRISTPIVTPASTGHASHLPPSRAVGDEDATRSTR